MDSVSSVSTVTRGLAIRRAKKRVSVTDEKRIKMYFYSWQPCVHATAFTTCN